MTVLIRQLKDFIKKSKEKLTTAGNISISNISSETTGSLAGWVECSPMVRETWVQSQVASYQRLLKNGT